MCMFFTLLQNYGKKYIYFFSSKHQPGHLRARKHREKQGQKCSLNDNGTALH